MTRREWEPPPAPEGGTQLLVVIALGCLVLGGVLGFTAGMDRQLRGGILQQRSEAMMRPDWVPLEELPTYLRAAFLSVVDPTFETGSGYRDGEEGNTLARELVRQIHLLGDGIGGEAKELVMAPVLEKRASKRDILELYLNRVSLGSVDDVPIFGVYYAAHEYFGKEPGELTVSEAATLAGLLLQPRIERPGDKPGAIGARRNEVLAALLEMGVIDSEEYSAAIEERLAFQPGISELPMSGRLPSPSDTMVIRLPADLRLEPSREAP